MLSVTVPINKNIKHKQKFTVYLTIMSNISFNYFINYSLTGISILEPDWYPTIETSSHS